MPFAQLQRIASTRSRALALLALVPGAQAQDKVIKVGPLKLIHSITPCFYDKFTPAGYRIEVVPFESPTDGKNPVLTGSVDFGTFGIAAAMLGIAAGGPLVIFAAQYNGTERPFYGLLVRGGEEDHAVRTGGSRADITIEDETRIAF